MKTRIFAVAAALGIVLSVSPLRLATEPPTAVAAEHQLPGMCNGRTDPNVVLNAHANGQPSAVPKYILNLSTDGAGKPTGILILGKGAGRLLVEEWCRLWVHIPGQPMGGHCEGEEPDEGALNAHAVGIAWKDGQRVLVRTDVRQTEEGRFFRVRYRVLGAHHEEAAVTEADDGCEDDGWTRVPGEGWAPLDQLKLR